MKRAHVKGRNGCVQCKQRRVRCDEAKPEWSRRLPVATMNQY